MTNKQDELLRRLRYDSLCGIVVGAVSDGKTIYEEAADEIERLQRELERLTRPTPKADEVKRLEEDARRYRLLRLHTAPAPLAKYLGLECEDIRPYELIEERVDKLLDAAALSHKEEAE